MKDLNPRKAALQNDRPVKIVKLNNDFVSSFIRKVFHESNGNAHFPDDLKLADMNQF